MESLFRKESMDQLTVHDRVGEYVSTTDVKGWLILVALLVLISGFMIWAFTGSLPIAISCMGYSSEANMEAHLFIDPEAIHSKKVDVGDHVHIIFPNNRQLEGRVISISSYPMTNEEIAEKFGYNDWVISKVASDDAYNYIMKIEAEENLEKDMLFKAQIIEATVKPIQLFLK